jgi:hypothetical protein
MALLFAVLLVAVGTLCWFLPVVGWPFALGAYALAIVVAVAGRGFSGASLLSLQSTGRERPASQGFILAGVLVAALLVYAIVNGSGR